MISDNILEDKTIPTASITIEISYDSESDDDQYEISNNNYNNDTNDDTNDDSSDDHTTSSSHTDLLDSQDNDPTFSDCDLISSDDTTLISSDEPTSISDGSDSDVEVGSSNSSSDEESTADIVYHSTSTDIYHKNVNEMQVLLARLRGHPSHFKFLDNSVIDFRIGEIRCLETSDGAMYGFIYIRYCSFIIMNYHITKTIYYAPPLRLSLLKTKFLNKLANNGILPIENMHPYEKISAYKPKPIKDQSKYKLHTGIKMNGIWVLNIDNGIYTIGEKYDPHKIYVNIS